MDNNNGTKVNPWIGKIQLSPQELTSHHIPKIDPNLGKVSDFVLREPLVNESPLQVRIPCQQQPLANTKTSCNRKIMSLCLVTRIRRSLSCRELPFWPPRLRINLVNAIFSVPHIIYRRVLRTPLDPKTKTLSDRQCMSDYGAADDPVHTTISVALRKTLKIAILGGMKRSSVMMFLIGLGCNV